MHLYILHHWGNYTQLSRPQMAPSKAKLGVRPVHCHAWLEWEQNSAHYAATFSGVVYSSHSQIVHGTKTMPWRIPRFAHELSAPLVDLLHQRPTRAKKPMTLSPPPPPPDTQRRGLQHLTQRSATTVTHSRHHRHIRYVVKREKKKD